MNKPPVKPTIFQPGQACAFFDKEHIYLGLIVSITDKMVQIHSETGIALNLNSARIVISSQTIFETMNPVATLAHFKAEIYRNSDQLSAETIWTKLHAGYQEVTLQDIIRLCELPDTDACRFALYELLRDNPCLFRHKGDTYYPLSEVESCQAKQAEKARKQEQKYRDKIENWVNDILAGKDDVKDLDNDSQSKLEQELSLHLNSKPILWLNHIFHKLAPDKCYNDILSFLRIALGQIDEYTNKYLALSGLPDLFPQKVLKAAEDVIPYSPQTDRTDLSALECWTVDAAETEDMDDAISLQKTVDGWQLGIHISDVTLFVAPDSELDKEAARRTSSIYLPGADIHMLPKAISCNKASLLAGQIRPALSLVCGIDKDYTITSTSIMLSTIKINQRFSYDDIEAYLNADSQEAELVAKIHLLKLITEAHLQHRIERGARIVADAEQTAARRLIAELMVIYNGKMADFAKQYNLSVYYRYLEEQIVELDEPDVTERLVFPASTLGVAPLTHQAMGMDVYAQMTSPLRRYADLVNQRQVVSFLKHKSPVYKAEDLEKLIPHIIQTRQNIRLVTHQAERYAQLSILKANGLDREFDAVVVKHRRNISILNIPEFNTRISVNFRSNYPKGTRLLIKIKDLNPETGIADIEINNS